MSSTILNNDFTVYYKAENRQKRIVWSGTTGVYTVQVLYSALMDLFDEAVQMDDGVPMSAQTPTEYTIGIIDSGSLDPWFIDVESVKHIKGGSIQTASWNRVEGSNTGIVKMGYTQTTAFVATDIGKDIVMTADGDTGTLLHYDATHLWIRPDTSAAANSFNDSPTANGAWTITSGTGAGNQSGGPAVSGESVWANIFTLGTIESGTEIYVSQNFNKISGWWPAGHIDILVQVQDFGTLVDQGILTTFAREYSKLYDHFSLTATGGRNPIPLSTSSDTNNQTAEATIGALTGITFTFGADTKDLNNGNGLRPYDVVINCGNNTLSNFYEYTKYATRRGATTPLSSAYYSRNGEQYITVGELRIAYDGQTGAFTEGVVLTGATADDTAFIIADHNNGNNTGTLIVRDVRGSFADNNAITDAATGVAVVNGTPEETLVSKQAPFGTFAGGKFFGARGVFIAGMDAADANNYELIDSTNTTQSPPISVPVRVDGLAAGDRVSVFRSVDTGSSVVDKNYLKSHATNNSTGSTSWETDAATPIPSDIPASGTVRLVKKTTGQEERIAYSSRNGNIFTLTSAHSGGYGADDTAYVPYVDTTASGAIVSVSIQYTQDRPIVTRVRLKGIQPFQTVGTLTDTGYSTTAIRTEDPIA